MEAAPPSSGKLTSIDDPQSFYLEGRYQLACAKCGAAGEFDVHHAVQKQRCRRERAPQHSPDNALRLCIVCHDRHTAHQELLPVACLRDENIAFAAHWLGVGPALVYFETYYTGTDPRVDHLLEQL